MSAAQVIDMDEQDYHRHPALSPSGAKVLLKCPARYAWQRTHPQPPKDAYDVGHVVHELVLGVGAGVVKVDVDTWRSKDAQAQRDAARAEGKTPLLTKDYDECVRIADAVLSHPIAGPIFTHDDGRAELSMFWHDEASGADLRGRLDWLHPAAVVDLKTTLEGGADPDRIARTAYDFGYYLSAAAYEEAALATGLIPEPVPHLLVVVEKTAPYVVTVAQFDDHFMALGREKWRQAIDLFADCTARDEWPTYTADIPTLTPPRWAS